MVAEKEIKTRELNGKEEVLHLTKSTNNGNFFESDKSKYWLRIADREFKGVKNKPEYYLSRKVGNELKFISGFFPTREENKYSYDVKNGQGMKQFMIAEFVNEGEKLILKEKVQKVIGNNKN